MAVDMRGASQAFRNIGTPWSRLDVGLLAGIALAAFLFARWYVPVYRAGGGAPAFYQVEFGPAVMLACGRGFVNGDYPAVPAVAAFLHQQVDTLRCEDLPSAFRVRPLDPLQGVTRYLMGAVSLVWRATGVSWRSADILISVFMAVTVAAAFATLRMVCGRSLSLFITLLWACSARHLQNVPHLRDYSKTPFFMVTLIAMGLAFSERRSKRLIGLGAIFGAIQGIGFGMRTDVVLNFVPFFLVLFAGAADGLLRNLRLKLTCAAAAMAVFVAVSYPVVRTYARDSSLWHIVLLGLSAPYDENLNIGFPRPAYSFPYVYNDSYVEGVVRAYWNRLHPGDGPLVMLTPPYDRACREYFVRVLHTFPGDMLTRGVASVVSVLNLPFALPAEHEVPTGVSNPTLVRLWQSRASSMRTFDGAGPVLISAATAVVGLYGLRYACVAFIVLWFWAALPAVEFQGRHIFQFEFVVLAALAFTLTLSWRLVAHLRPESSREAVVRTLKSVATVAALLTVVGAAVTVARAIQLPRVRALLAAYTNAPRVPLEASSIPFADGQVRLAADLFHASKLRNDVQEVLIQAEFDFAQCGNPPAIVATFRYEETDPPSQNFSRQVPLEYLGAAPTRVFLPVYSVTRDWKTESRFVGLDVPSTFVRCVRLSRVTDSSALALLIPVTIEPDWQRKLYQRVRLDRGLGY